MFPHSEQLYANLNLHFGSHCVIFNSIGFSSYSITRQCAKEGSEKSQKVFVCRFGTLNKISCKGHFGFLLPLDWLQPLPLTILMFGYKLKNHKLEF